MSAKVFTTKALAHQVGADEAQIMAERFRRVQDAGTTPCHEAYYFGRDMPYSAPKLPCGYPLRHVHVVPLSDPEGMQRWRRQMDAGQEQTSDIALVYVKNAYNEFLLIAMIQNAHAIASMTTPTSAQLMERFALIGEEFISSDLNNH